MTEAKRSDDLMSRIFRAVAATPLLLGLWAVLGAAPAQATPIASMPVRVFSTVAYESGGPIIEDSLVYSVWINSASDPTPEIGEGFLLLSFTLTSADNGQTLIASALNMGPSFNSAIALLTNFTLADYISATAMFPDGGGSGDGTTEVGVLDLRGQFVGSVKLVIDQLSILTPGTDPNDDGIWTDMFFTGNLVFDTDVPVADVPEPGTMGLLLAGLGALALARRRRRG
jgi:hypothetical protein